MYPRDIFIQLLNSDQSKLSSYLGSDWWWSYALIKDHQIRNLDVTFRKTQHDGGWRHFNEERIGGSRFKPYVNFLLIKPKFLYNHFIVERCRFNIISDKWIVILFFKTIFVMFKEYFMAFLKSYKLFVKR
jgi:hypothetical protein